MSKSHELAWCAGFFDGEGWIKIQKRGGKYLGFYLRIGINHVKKDPLTKIQKVLGGKLRFDDKVFGNRKPRWVWTLSTQAASDALKQMLPYMSNKNEVSEIALEFSNTVGLRGQKVSEEIQIYRKLLADQIVKINASD